MSYRRLGFALRRPHTEVRLGGWAVFIGTVLFVLACIYAANYMVGCVCDGIGC